MSQKPEVPALKFVPSGAEADAARYRARKICGDLKAKIKADADLVEIAQLAADAAELFLVAGEDIFAIARDLQELGVGEAVVEIAMVTATARVETVARAAGAPMISQDPAEARTRAAEDIRTLVAEGIIEEIYSAPVAAAAAGLDEVAAPPAIENFFLIVDTFCAEDAALGADFTAVLSHLVALGVPAELAARILTDTLGTDTIH